MHDFMFWSGVIAWVTIGVVGMLMLADYAIDWLVTSLWTKREFLAFVADRLKKRNQDQTIPGG